MIFELRNIPKLLAIARQTVQALEAIPVAPSPLANAELNFQSPAASVAAAAEQLQRRRRARQQPAVHVTYLMIYYSHSWRHATRRVLTWVTESRSIS